MQEADLVLVPRAVAVRLGIAFLATPPPGAGREPQFSQNPDVPWRDETMYHPVIAKLTGPAIVDISELELRVLIAYLETGNTRDAAAQLGRSVQTVKNTLWTVRSRLGVKSTAQAIFLLHDKLVA